MGNRCSDDPSHAATGRTKPRIKDEQTNVTRVTNKSACVTLMRAALICCRARWIDATTEQPAPTISPKPVKSISSGMQMLMAAMPSLPTPWPTKMPSATVTAEMLSIPSSVGTKNLRNRRPTCSVPRSNASLSINRNCCHSPAGTKKAGQASWFYPVILSGRVCDPPMRITKLLSISVQR